MTKKTINATQPHEHSPKHETVKPVVQKQEGPGSLALDPAAILQRAALDPSQLSPGDVLALQRQVGNQAVARLLRPSSNLAPIQKKLTVGAADDLYEQEADRIADQVVSSAVLPGAEHAQKPLEPAAHPARGAAQRQDEDDELQAKPLAAGITPLTLRREIEEEEETLQAKPLLQREGDEEELLQGKASDPLQREAEDEDELQSKRAVQDPRGSFEAGTSVEERLDATAGSGNSMPGSLREYMEPRFGADFSAVRLHTGSEAADLSRAIHAQAFTRGQDIYLGEGKYDPDSTSGRRLLAHELTHTIQQSGGIQRFTHRSEVLKGVDAGKSFFGLKTSWGDLIFAIAAYEAADLQHDQAKKEAALQQVLKACESWLNSSSRSKLHEKDQQKRAMIESIKREAIKEAAGSKEEADFTAHFSTDALSTGERAQETGKKLVEESRKKASSHTVAAIESATEEMYASGNQRARQLYAILSALNAGLLQPHHESFETVQGLLTGGPGMPKIYADFKHKAAPSATVPDTALMKDLEVFGKWKKSPHPAAAVEYLQSIAASGQIDPKFSLLLNLGQIDGDHVNGVYVRDLIEQYFTTDLVTKGLTDSKNSQMDPGTLQAQVNQVRTRLDDLKKFCAQHEIAAPGDTGWRGKAPWKDLATFFPKDMLNRIESTITFYETVAKTGEKVVAGEDLKNAASGSDAQKACDEFIEMAIIRLLTYMKAMRGSVHTSASEQQEILAFVDQWKKETLNLELKFGLKPNTIGEKIVAEKRIGFWQGKGMDRAQLSHILDVVSGTVGNIYQTIGTKKDNAAVNPTDAGAKQVASAVDEHTERQMVTVSAGDMDALADDLVKIGQSDPKALLAYLLEIRGDQEPGGKAGPTDFEPPTSAASARLNPDERSLVIHQAFEALNAKLGIRGLGQERVQLHREKRAALEKIVTIFKFGSSVVKDGQGYIAVRQALTDRVYRSKSLLKAVGAITETDRAMIRSDADLRAQIDAALANDPNDRKKIVGILGFELLDKARQAAGAAEFVGGVNAATGAELDESAVAVPQKSGSVDYDAILHKWAAVFDNNYHRFAQDVGAVRAAKSFGRGLLTLGTLGMNKVVGKSKPDTKAMLLTAYQAQDAIRQAVLADPKKRPNVDEQVKYWLIKLGLDVPEVSKIKAEDAALRDYFDRGEFISMDRLVNLGMGVVSADEAFLLDAVKNASSEDLIHHFSDIDKFYELFGRFDQQVNEIQKGGSEAVIQDRFSRTKDLQTLLLAYTPGVKISFVRRLEESRRIKAGTRRAIVTEIQNRLASAFESDQDFREKMDRVRADIAFLDRRATARVQTGQSGGDEEVSLGGLSIGLSAVEGRASSEQIQEQTRIQTTRALRGLSLRKISGKKAALMESRADYLGTGRSLIGSRASGSQQKATQLSALQEAEADLRAKELKLAHVMAAITVVQEISTKQAELDILQAENVGLRQSYDEKYAAYRTATGSQKGKIAEELRQIYPRFAELDQKIAKANEQIQSLNKRLGPLMAAVDAGITSPDEATFPDAADLEAKRVELTLAIDLADKTVAHARQTQEGGKASTDLELSQKVGEMASSRENYDQKVTAFLAYREKVKTIVNVVIQLLITAIVIGATAGAGTTAAIPFWVGIIVSAVSRSIEEIIQASYDPEQITLLEGAYEVLSRAIVSAITSTVGQGIDALQAAGAFPVGSGHGKLLDKSLTFTYKQAVVRTTGLVAGEMRTGLRASILTGDSAQEVENKFSKATWLNSVSLKLTNEMNILLAAH